MHCDVGGMKHKLTSVSLALAVASTSLGIAAPIAHAEAPQGPVRLIAGFGLEFGGFVDQAEGLAGGGNLHLGVHFFGVEIYGLIQGLMGSYLGGPHDGVVVGMLWNSAMFGFGASIFHLAVGPSLDYAWSCTNSAVETNCYQGNPLFGLDARASIQVDGFALTLDVHPTLYGPSTVTAIVLGVGFEY